MGKIKYQNIENTIRECGNMGGIADQIYAAPKSFFKSFSSKKTCEVDRDFEEMNLLTEGQDVLFPGKSLMKIYNTMEKGSLNAERQGEIDGISHKIVLNIFTPGLDSKSLAMLSIPNQDWIFYVKAGKQMFRVGGPDFAAKMSPDGQAGTGDSTASLKGNQMSFFTYEDGFAPEIIDIAAIEAMLTAVDESLTVAFTPADGTKAVAVGDSPLITFSEAVNSADTSLTLTVDEMKSFIKLQKVDFNGDYVEEIPFTPSIATDTVITIDPDENLENDETYEIKFDNAKILSIAERGRVNGVNFARFSTADV